MVKDIFDYHIKIDRRRKQPTFVVYLVGQWDYHMMDWRGLNIRRIKAPNQPIFHKLSDAIKWANKNYKKFKTVDGEGEHVSDWEDKDEKGIIDDYTLEHVEEFDKKINKYWKKVKNGEIGVNEIIRANDNSEVNL